MATHDDGPDISGSVVEGHVVGTTVGHVMLRLHLFGALSFSVITGDAPECVPTPVSGRPGSLLAYLALARGRYFSRSKLITVLWAEECESVHSGTFNTVLWRLRKLVEAPPLKHGEVITCDRRGAVGLNPQAHLQLDVDEFASSVLPAFSKPIERMSESDVEALRRGIELYTADILTDLADEWALREREKHRRHYLNALGRMMQLCSIARDHGAAIRYAQSILDHDAMREDVHRELMRLFLQSGQRAMALRQFEVCRSALKRELAIQPMHETVSLYQSIAEQAIAAGPQPLAGRHATGPTLEQLFAPHEAGPLPPHGGSPASARELIEAARRHLAQADSDLQRSLPFL